MTNWTEVNQPKVWTSRFPRSLDSVSFSWSCNGKDKTELIHATRYFLKKVNAESSPQFLFFKRGKEIPSSIKDAFKVNDGLQVISPALRNVLVDFDLDGVQLFRVPIFADENGTTSGLPDHYVMNVYGSKDALLPEFCENIEKQVFPRESEPRSDANWVPTNDLDVAAVSESAGSGADIWRDPNLTRTLFFSDRLKQAIDAAGLKTKALSFAAARVFQIA